MNNRQKADIVSYDGKMEDMAQKLKHLETKQGHSRDALYEFKYYKEKEYRSLENGYYKLRFDFKECKEANNLFYSDIAQANREYTSKLEDKMQAVLQKALDGLEEAQMKTKEKLKRKENVIIKRQGFKVFNNKGANDGEHSGRSAKAVGQKN